MRFLLLFCLALFPFLTIGQNEQDYRDSLENVLQNIYSLEKEQPQMENHRKKVKLLCLLSKQYDGIDSTQTFDYAFSALEISEENNYAQGVVDANFTIGRALMYSNPNEALVYLKKGNEIANKLIKTDSSKELLKLWADGTYNLGLTYGYLDKHRKELDITESVIPSVEKLNDSLFLANISAKNNIQSYSIGHGS